MKKYFISFLMILALGITAEAAAQHHRHHPSVSANINVSKDSSNVGITAYSDTTDADSTDTDTTYVASHSSNNDYSTANDFFEGLACSGFSMGAISFLIAVLLIVAVLSPIILIAVILYFIFRNRNQKYKLAQAAIAQGRTVPQELLRENRQTNEYLWSRGIRNASIGLGLVCMFWIIGAEPLIGVGLLVFFMGVGQTIIAKTTHKSESTKNDDFSQSRSSNEDLNSSFKMEDEVPLDEEEPNSEEKASEKK